ncbi:TBCC domain-containing protein 1 isoform X2 [Phalaenopsis equestris]|uniref:TBCC domain-containing protein 1 isoform X2 n=1 Tax=Phalaenopsis equestris TaxID=78828 RepID=UPI0009E45BE0|nr:TBCC domain-containing protein 1 isoform X2 [Phalaenopsis equestris]
MTESLNFETSARKSSPAEPSGEEDSGGHSHPLLQPRRELFEYGLLPIPKLIFTDGIVTLIYVKEKLLQRHATALHRVDALGLADGLQISLVDAGIVLDTLVSVLPYEPEDLNSVDVRDLVLFLYIQSYRRLVSKTHKDSAAVADVWPSTSAFDGYLSALTPIQLKRCSSRRSMPSPADEEAHQLSYLEKHMENIVSVLADSVEGEGAESLVLTLDSFQRLGLLIQFFDDGHEGIPLSQACPFFANCDDNASNISVSASKVLDWLLRSVAISLEHIVAADKSPTRGTGMGGINDVDVTMMDASANKAKLQSSGLQSGLFQPSTVQSRSQTIVDGISKASVVKQVSDTIRHPVKVLNCHDSVIYILAPLSYATVYGCSDATVVVGAVGKALRVEHCERVQIIAAAKRICIVNCRECVFYLGINHSPLVLGDNHKLQVAPYNTFYPQLLEHMSQVGINAIINRWNEPIVLGMVDPHDSLPHPAGLSDTQSESATCLDPDQFTNFLIPKWYGANLVESTKALCSE